MPKTRSQKEALLAEVTDRIGRAKSIVFVTVSGVKVDEIEEIRDGLFKEGLQLQVAKNSLLKLALAGAGTDVPSEVTDQPVALVYSYDDAVAGPRLAAPFAKEIDALQILGGIADGRYLTPSQVQAYASLPSREALLAQLLGTLNGPARGFVTVLSGNIRGLVTALSAIRDQKPA